MTIHADSSIALVNPKIFINMTEEQSEAAKFMLGRKLNPDVHNPREFSLDIAKFLYVPRHAVDQLHSRRFVAAGSR